MSEQEIVARCVLCNYEAHEGDKQTHCCPQCGTMYTPCDPQNDVKININLHELHILFTWAERWADQCNNEDMKGFLYSASDRIRQQTGSDYPLLLSEEMRDLKRAYPGTEFFDSAGKEIDI